AAERRVAVRVRAGAARGRAAHRLAALASLPFAELDAGLVAIADVSVVAVLARVAAEGAVDVAAVAVDEIGVVALFAPEGVDEAVAAGGVEARLREADAAHATGRAVRLSLALRRRVGRVAGISAAAGVITGGGGIAR